MAKNIIKEHPIDDGILCTLRGRLLALLAKVVLGFKEIGCHKRPSLFIRDVSDEKNNLK
jgi:hypothetical protein